MDFNKIIEEIYDGGGGNYPAYSQAPRKDFAPVTQSGNYAFPYQQGGSIGDVTEPPPDAPISFPWPMQTVTTDLADGFVFILTAANKMSTALTGNPTLKKEQKEKLVELFKHTKQTLDMLKDIGTELGKLNLAGPQPSQNPVPRPGTDKPQSIPNLQTGVLIKLP